MSIVTGITGFRAVSPQNMVLHAGAAFVNINLAELRSLAGFDVNDWADAIDPDNTWTSAAGNLVAPRAFGATREGAEARFEAPISQIGPIDGLRGPVMGLDKRDTAQGIIVVTVLEVRDPDTLQIALGSSDKDEWSSYDEITPRLAVVEGDYIPNIAIAASVNDGDVVLPVIVVLENAIAINSTSFKTQDGNAVGLQLELRGSSPLTAPLDQPIHFFLPKNAGSGS
ncbi:MAG: hypothetical protein AMXMBFR33_01450 [Candidatus Xenobia bacterium]